MQWIKQFVTSATGRLAASYLLIIMLMSIGFSCVFYSTSARELGRQAPPREILERLDDNSGRGNAEDRLEDDVTRQQVQDFLDERAAEGRQTLLRRLILLNLLALVLGCGLSVYLARRTLIPIERNMEAQSQFVSDASHELRTPLTAMQTTNEVALRRKSLTAADARLLIAQNIEEIIKLRALTDGLLKLARQDHDSIPRTTVSLQDVTAEAMNRVVLLAQSKRISIDDNVAAIKVLGDATSLVQVLVILLDNAIKYSPAGTTIRLSSEHKSRYGYLHVRDQGPGIRPYDMRKIFDRFYRADQSRSHQTVAGNGIGLSLAKKIMQGHGGDITATSTVGQGSTFTFKIPLS